MRQEITEMFDYIESRGCYYIDEGYGGDKLKNAIEQEKEKAAEKIERRFGVIISNELIDLRNNIEKEIRNLRESFRVSGINSKLTSSFNLNLGNVVDQLDFKFGDLVNWATYLGGAVYTGYLIGIAVAGGANWWNPIGWGLLTLSAFIAILGDSKEEKAKAKLRENIGEAKNEFFSKTWPKMSSDLDQQFRNKMKSFDYRMKTIIEDFKTIKIHMNTVVNDVKFSSIKFRNSINFK